MVEKRGRRRREVEEEGWTKGKRERGRKKEKARQHRCQGCVGRWPLASTIANGWRRDGRRDEEEEERKGKRKKKRKKKTF